MVSLMICLTNQKVFLPTPPCIVYVFVFLPRFPRRRLFWLGNHYMKGALFKIWNNEVICFQMVYSLAVVEGKQTCCG